MTRYIDADALYSSIAKDTYVLTDRINSRDYGMYLIGIKEKIDEAPTADVVEVTDKSMESLIKGLEILGDTKDRADVVEVVRCKDCRWYEDQYRKIFENCVRGGRTIPMQPTDYCSYGERRE